MKLKALVIGAATAAFLAIPSAALAAWGQVTGDVNMRTGPSAVLERITTLPAGARVWVNGGAGNGWISVSYNGRTATCRATTSPTPCAPMPPPGHPPPAAAALRLLAQAVVG